MVPGNRPDGSVAGAGGIRRDLVPRAILSRCAWQFVTNVSDAVGSRVADSGSPGRPRTMRRVSPHVTDVAVRGRLRCRPQAGHEPGLCGRRYTPARRCRRHGRARARGDRQLRRRRRRHGARAPSERRPHRCRPDRRTRLRARRGRSTPHHARAGRSGACAAPAPRSSRSSPTARASASPTSAIPAPTCSATASSPASPAITRSCRASSTRAASPSRRRRRTRAGRGSCAPCRTAARPSPTCSCTPRSSATATSSAPTASPPSSTTRWSARCCRTETDRDAAVARFVRLANAGGGPDNITCIVADLVDAPAADGGEVVVGAAAEDREPA